VAKPEELGLLKGLKPLPAKGLPPLRRLPAHPKGERDGHTSLSDKQQAAPAPARPPRTHPRVPRHTAMHATGQVA
jgi:hypothetical protein